MNYQTTNAADLGCQGDLFNRNPVIKKVTKPAPERPLPLQVLGLKLGDVQATARKYLVAKRTVYHVVFSDERQPLVVTVAATFDDEDFWTSLPEGRQQEAEQVGKLIEDASNR